MVQTEYGIVSYGAYLPRYRIKAETICSVWGQNAQQIRAGLQVEQKTVPGIDEDAATIAVEAARNALRPTHISSKDIGAIYIGSESHPYAVKPTGTIVGEAIGAPTSYTTADFEFACKAGTAAIQTALAMVKSAQSKIALAGGADTAQARPGDPLEYTAAAGGAIFVLGSENVIAVINHTVSFTTDTPDFWRRAQQEFPSHGGAFTGEPAYFRHVISATKNLMKTAKTKPSDYDHVVFHQPNGKFPRRVAKQLGFTDEQIKIGLLVPVIGNTYSGASLLGLANVLDHAKPGDRIIVTSYGSGAGSDSFDITVTKHIEKTRKQLLPLSSFMQDVTYLTYPEYLKNIRQL